MIKPALISISASLAIVLTGCASVWTSTDYTPYVGNDIAYIGQGGAMEIMGGIEVWKQGLPNKPYKIIGVVTGDIKDGLFAEHWLMEASAIEAKEHGADAIVSQAIQYRAGTPYINTAQTNVTVNQNNTANIYGNSGAVAVAQGNRAVVNTGASGFGAGFAQGFNSGAALAMSMPKLKGTFLAIKYVEVEKR